jgi:hypothetical protein
VAIIGDIAPQGFPIKRGAIAQSLLDAAKCVGFMHPSGCIGEPGMRKLTGAAHQYEIGLDFGVSRLCLLETLRTVT